MRLLSVLLVLISIAALSTPPPSSTPFQTTSAATTPTGSHLVLVTDKDTYYGLGEPVHIEGYPVTPSVTWTYACPPPSKMDCGLAVSIRIFDDSGRLVHNGTSDPNWADYKRFYYPWRVPCPESLREAVSSYRIEAAMTFLGEEFRGEKTIDIAVPLGVISPWMEVTTDRSRYSPGEVVQIKGFVQLEWFVSDFRVDIVLNVTQRTGWSGEHSIFKATLEDVPIFFLMPSCPWSMGNEHSFPTGYFTTSFILPQTASNGIYTVHAYYAPDSLQARAFFTVGEWEYTATLVVITTTESDVVFYSQVWTTMDSFSYPVGWTITHGTKTAINVTTMTTAIPEFSEATLGLILGTSLFLGLVLLRRRTSQSPRK